MPQHALAILVGALFAFYANRLPDPFWSSFAPLLLLIACCQARNRFVLLLAASFLWSSALFQNHLSSRLLNEFDDRSLLLAGTVADIPQRHSDRLVFYLDDLAIEGYPAKMPRRARFSWYQTDTLPRAGERWQFAVKLRQQRGMLNPSGFDYEKWQFVQRIDAGGYILDSTLNRRLEFASAVSLHYWRGGLADNIDRDCGGCRQRGLIKALALGYRGDIEARHAELLQHSGTAHLLAISGLHVGMVSTMFYLLGACCWRFRVYRYGIERRTFASIFALLAALGYAALAGFSLPTLRALLMFAVVMVALQLRTRINLLQAISLALVLILLFDPLAAGSVSLWLSFGALMVIAYMQFRFAAGMSAWRTLLIVQCYFTLLFAPLGMLVFGQLNLAGLPANMVAIPLLSFVILPLVLCACLLSAIAPDLSRPLFDIADRVIGLLLDYLDWLLDAGFRAIPAKAYPEALLLLGIVALAVFLVPGFRGLRVAGVLVLTAILLWRPAQLQHGDYQLTVLDVGMGTSLLLRTRHHSLVYDFGGGLRGFNAAETALLPGMKHYGLEIADLYVVSHVDHDHSAGFASFLDRYSPEALLSGTPDELRAKFALQHGVRSCHGYPEWHWDGVLFRFLDSGAVQADSTNDRSCVLQVIGHQRALLPGDIEKAREQRLVEIHGERLAADFLVAPHHGSATSSSQSFLREVGPANVVFTLARNNRWGFPDNAVVERYRAIGTRLYRSDFDGAVTITSRADGALVQSIRIPPRRIWRRW